MIPRLFLLPVQPVVILISVLLDPSVGFLLRTTPLTPCCCSLPSTVFRAASPPVDGDNDDDCENVDSLIPNHQHHPRKQERLPPQIWIQEAEDDFVEADENLEEGEVCLCSYKAFASSTNTNKAMEIREPRFLAAGALVQRPTTTSNNSFICDAWIADSILEEGGPNLQIQGACQLIDQLLCDHLMRNENSIMALQSLVVQVDDDSSSASYQASLSRGFQALKDRVRATSIYTSTLYDNNLEGLVLDETRARTIYSKLLQDRTLDTRSKERISTILHLLPDDDTIRRCLYKRYQVPSKQSEW